MDKLFTLLEIQRGAIEAQSRAALLHNIVNETRKLIPYTQAVFCNTDGLSLTLEKISGNAVLDPQSTYASDVKTSLRAAMSAPLDNSAVVLLDPQQHKTAGALLLFRTADEGLLGGLWIENDKPYGEAEQRILEELSATYAQCLALWKLRKSHRFLSSIGGKKARWICAAAFIALALFPVRLSITAPAEIIAREAEIITAPFDGTIESVDIEPGDAVTADQIVVTMEHRSLQAQMDMAQQEMAVAQAALSRLQRESLAAPDKKPNLTALQEEIESKKIAYEYARALKERSEIRSERGGIAVFSEASGLRGRPVRTGDKIMSIADPAEYELLIRVPVEAMTPVARDAHVKFFLNISPLSGHGASIRSVGYQASPDADGLLTYKILARLPDDAKDLRIGWKGTATIKGEWTILSYALARRPLIALRNLVGV